MSIFNDNEKMDDKLLKTYIMAHMLFAHKDEYDVNNPFSIAKVIVDNTYWEWAKPHQEEEKQKVMELSKEVRKETLYWVCQWLKLRNISEDEKKLFEYYCNEKFCVNVGEMLK
jgi:hypothetical protein